MPGEALRVDAGTFRIVLHGPASLCASRPMPLGRSHEPCDDGDLSAVLTHAVIRSPLVVSF